MNLNTSGCCRPGHGGAGHAVDCLSRRTLNGSPGSCQVELIDSSPPLRTRQGHASIWRKCLAILLFNQCLDLGRELPKPGQFNVRSSCGTLGKYTIHVRKPAELGRIARQHWPVHVGELLENLCFPEVNQALLDVGFRKAVVPVQDVFQAVGSVIQVDERIGQLLYRAR